MTLRRRATEFFVGSAFHGLERGQLEGRSLVAAALWNATLYTLGLVSAAMVRVCRQKARGFSFICVCVYGLQLHTSEYLMACFDFEPAYLPSLFHH